MPRSNAVEGAAALWRTADGPARWPSAGTGATGEQILLDAAARAMRHPRDRVALALHLSRLRAPAPRPHHRRVARAILADAAARREGEVFAMRNGDLVLLCRNGAEIAALPGILARLLRLEAADPASVASVWPLAQDGAALLDYAAARVADPASDADTTVSPPPVSPLALDRVAAALRRVALADFLTRQTAVRLEPRPRQPATLRPLFHTIGVSLPGLAGAIEEAGTLAADPALAPLLAAHLDAGLLRLLADAVGRGGALDGARPGLPPLHLTLTLPAALSPGFAALAQACRAAGARLDIAVRLVEAVADPAGLRILRDVAAEHGCRLALTGMPVLALTFSRPWGFGVDRLLLDWSPSLLHLPAEERAGLREAFAACDPARVVLLGADDEAALRWGGAHGIRCFQGRHVAAMLAASRMLGCTSVAGCTFAQCAARAAAVSMAGRALCRRPDLLDAGVPGTAGP